MTDDPPERHAVRGPQLPPARPPDGIAEEAQAVAQRYARRAADDRYDPLRPEVMQARQAHDRAFAAMLRRHLRQPVQALDVLDVGCGHGSQLLQMVQWGFDPVRLTGSELLPARVAAARARLPATVRLLEGDATTLALPEAGFDLVLQSTVFSSLLDDAYQQRLASAMWRWLRPGGAVVWYDFTMDNPRNPDVRGVPLTRVRALFPAASRIDARRLTLARALARVHPALPRMFDAVPMLRTHVLAWIAKPRSPR